jgi:hypothetical protein
LNENADHKEENGAGKFEIAKLIMECLCRYDTISQCNGDEGSQLPCDIGGTNKTINFDNYDANVLDMIELLRESRILLYEG